MTTLKDTLLPSMVIWKGRDGRKDNDFCYYTVADIREPEVMNRAYATPDAIPDLMALGYEIEPHWIDSCAQKGWKCVLGLNFRPCSERNYYRTEIAPEAQAALFAARNGGRITNKAFVGLLSIEDN